MGQSRTFPEIRLRSFKENLSEEGHLLCILGNAEIFAEGIGGWHESERAERIFNQEAFA